MKRASFCLLSRLTLQKHRFGAPSTRNYISAHHPPLPSSLMRHLLACNRNSVTINCLQHQSNPFRNVETLVEKQPHVSSSQRIIKEKSQLQEAFEQAETSEEMISVFEDMTSCFEGEDLGLPALEVGLMLDQEGENPEKIFSFALKAFFFLDRADNKPSILAAVGLRLMGSANYKLKHFNDCLKYLNAANTIIVTLEEAGLCDIEDIRNALHAIQLDLANVNTTMGRRDEALCNLKKCLEIKEAMLEEDSKALGVANRDLAEAYVGVLKYKEALPYGLKDLQIHETGLGLYSAEVAHDRRVLGLIYTGLEDHQKAFRKVLQQNDLSQKVLKKWGLNSDLLCSEIDFADTHIALGRYQEALNTLDNLVHQTAKESESRALIFITMAKALYHQENFMDSKRCLEIACGILNKKEDVSPVEVAEAYSEISMQYESMHEFATAISLLERTFAILNKVPQEQHSKERVLARLGWLLLDRGEAEKAITYFENALLRLKETFGSMHLGIGYIYNSLGAAYAELNELESAACMFESAKDILEVSLGPHHVDSIEACQNLSKVLGDMKDYVNAAELQEQVVNAWKLHGPSAVDKFMKARQLLELLTTKACENLLDTDVSDFSQGGQCNDHDEPICEVVGNGSLL